MRKGKPARKAQIGFAAAILFAAVLVSTNLAAAQETEPWIAASPDHAPVGATITITGRLDCSAVENVRRDPYLLLLDPRIEDDPLFFVSKYHDWGPAGVLEGGSFSKSVTIPKTLGSYLDTDSTIHLPETIDSPVVPGEFRLIALCWPLVATPSELVKVEGSFVVTGPDGELPTTTTTSTTTSTSSTTTTAPTTTTAAPPSSQPPTTAAAEVLAATAPAPQTASGTVRNSAELPRTGSKQTRELTLTGFILLGVGTTLLLESRRHTGRPS